MSAKLQQQDVERLLRDVLSTYGLRVSALSVTPIPTGWHLVITDVANGLLSTNVQDGPAALVRTALTNWILNQS